jgi:sterol desaturase/sphingolipid hydroxylase (fatty acid hydroxylase superfamily)
VDLARFDPTHVAVPFFLVSLVVEKSLADRAKRAGRAIQGHSARDSAASLAMGIGSLVFVGAINAASFAAASYLSRWKFINIGEGWLAWLVAFVAWDFSFYWHHRMEHEHRILWACHVSHHSSRYFNLTTALRQPWSPVATIFFFVPWALVGISPAMLMFVGGLNLIYQFWIHTELIDRMPGWFSYVFNTPSHHRVHHGSNAEYLDKNYGGVFILWDRMFGTFEQERARPVYGLTKNITSHNPLVIAFHEYVALGDAAFRTRSLRAFFSVLWQSPAMADLEPPPPSGHLRQR